MLETVEATAEVFTNHTADKNNPCYKRAGGAG